MLGITWLNRSRRRSRSGFEMAVCGNSEGQHQLGRNAQTFEDRLMLTVTGFGMAGDSLVDEYLNETHPYAQSWVELLGEYRSADIPLGILKENVADTWGEPRRNGYEYNWGRYGATTATLLSDGQHTGLAGQIAANKVSHVAIAIGPNDFLPDFTGPYIDIYSGNWTQTQIDTHVNAVIGRITTALNAVDINNAKVILSNIVDYGLAPLTQSFFPVASRRQLVTDVINVVNEQLGQLASDRNIPLLDLSRLAVDLLGGSSFRIGGNLFTATAGVGVQNIFVDDGVHPHTGTSAIIANAYLQALNTGYGESIQLFSEQELTTILSLPYISNTLSFDFPSYVVAPPLVSLNVNNATLAEAGETATVTATLSAVSAQTVTVNLGFSGTATNIGDYTRSDTRIVIPAGGTTGSVTLTAVQDAIEEADETIVVDITSVSNGIEFGIQQVTATILDDDGVGDFSVKLGSLDGTSGFRLAGIDVGDAFGRSVSSAGDVNGDGFDDLIIGARFADPDGDSGAGESYVVFGKSSSFTAAVNLSTLDGTDGFRMDGVDGGDQSGVSVSSAGDVNGDGLDDLIIGAWGSDPGGDSTAGESYVVFGKSSGFTAAVDLATLDGTTGFRLDGIDAGDKSGCSVSSAGDVNGDGFDDLIIGAYGGDPGGDIDAGESYVIFGKSSGFTAALDLATLDGTNGFRLDGIDAGDAFGVSVSSTSDVNADGFDDLIIGARFADPDGDSGAGESYVVFGKSSGFSASLDLSTLNGTDGFRLDGTDANDRSGFSVSSAGDVNGDGFDDLIIGARFADPDGDSGAGESYVVFGKSSGFSASLDLSTLNGTDGFRLDGTDAGDLSGHSVSSAGDVNADGFDDLIIGALRGDPSGDIDAGESYVVFGKSSDFAAAVDLATLDSTDGFRLDGIDADDLSGRSVSSAGDVNGDGFDDLIIGADYANPGGDSGAGESYVVFGGNFTGGGETQVGDAAANTLTANQGVEAVDILVGGQGSDTLISDGGQDVLYGGEGADTLAIVSTAFQRVAGGNGTDTLRLDGSGLTLDLTTLADNTLTDIEVIDISGSGNNSLSLNLLEVLNVSSHSNTLVVMRDAGDTVSVGTGWTQAGVQLIDGRFYQIRTQGAATLAVQESDFDFGDAPDSGLGTSEANYETTFNSGGPLHAITPGLFMGDTVDGDNGMQQDFAAGADDRFSAGEADDEDGVPNPLDLLGTIRAAPTVTLLVTNTTGAIATLAGWIDYNRNGVFENVTERATVTVATGTTDGRVTLTFPSIPDGSAGKTYARFRLSTDVAFAANPGSIGVATDGEVEDYVFSITSFGGTPVDNSKSVKIASETNGGPTLADVDVFGSSLASIGDVDGDGMNDLAVGAYGDDTGGDGRGAVHVLFLNSNGTVKSSTKIANETSGGPTLADGDDFGRSVTSVGDLNGDGVGDLAVGARGDATGGSFRGAVHILFLNSNGTVKSSTKIANGTNGGPTLADGDRFGESIASVGDLDGDGVADLAVGATDDNTVGDHSGAVYVLFLNNDGTVKSATKIASDTGGGPTLSSGDEFGISVTSVGDIDGDGVTDLAVGADGDDTGFSVSGAVHVLLLNSNGTVKSATKIANETNGGPTLTDNDVFGFSVTSVGDLDGDGVGDLAVGATDNDTGGRNRGAVYLLFLNSNGTVKSSTKIANETNGGPTLADSDLFGFSVTPVGDLDGDGVADLAVGARSDDTGGINRGAVHVLFLRGPQPETLSLPAGGDSYQVLTAGSDLVVRFAGGAEQFRQSAASISSLTINGSPNAEVVTVLNDAGVVATPISFIGGDGNDRFDATLAMGPVTLDGGGGDDTLLGGLQNDIMDGGDGADLVEISGPNIIVTNSSASRTDVDTLTSVERLILVASGTGSMIDASGFTLGPVTIVGSGGADTLKGGSGNDLILAGSGRDSVSGGAGNDFIMGNSGSDTLSGDSGNDTILGGRGRDSIDGGANPDHLRGGGGGDTIRGGDGNDRVMGGASRDVLDGDDGSDTLLGGGGRDNLAGGLGADNLNGSTRDDTFNQKVGPDTLIGGQRPSARPAPVTLLATSSNSKIEPPRSPTLIASAKAPEDIDDAFGDSLLPKLLEL